MNTKTLFKPTIFLQGGLGNIYYQVNYIHGQHEDFLVSNILFSNFFLKLLGHTNHKNPKLELPTRAGNLRSILYLFFILFDFINLKVFKKTLFVEFDTTRHKSIYKPKRCFIYLGYFQNKETTHQKNFYDLYRLMPSLGINNLNKELPERIVIHFRCGDYLRAYGENNLITNMPYPNQLWFKDALMYLKGLTNENKILIVTDNISEAKAFFNSLKENKFSFYFASGSLDEDLKRMLKAEILITFNSTLSLAAGESSKNIYKAIVSDYLSKKISTNSFLSKTVII